MSLLTEWLEELEKTIKVVHQDQIAEAQSHRDIVLIARSLSTYDLIEVDVKAGYTSNHMFVNRMSCFQVVPRYETSPSHLGGGRLETSEANGFLLIRTGEEEEGEKEHGRIPDMEGFEWVFRNVYSGGISGFQERFLGRVSGISTRFTLPRSLFTFFFATWQLSTS